MHPSYGRLDSSRLLICDLKALRLLASFSLLERLSNSLEPRYLNECLPWVTLLNLGSAKSVCLNL